MYETESGVAVASYRLCSRCWSLWLRAGGVMLFGSHVIDDGVGVPTVIVLAV